MQGAIRTLEDSLQELPKKLGDCWRSDISAAQQRTEKWTQDHLQDLRNFVLGLTEGRWKLIGVNSLLVGLALSTVANILSLNA